ncbi:hypothetical protein HLG78_04680 [Candidatus Absconditicoccus praedator]|nr:hypothetical protein HLG78_04680 [Candidatus Absconditicoccus praedator]
MNMFKKILNFIFVENKFTVVIRLILLLAIAGGIYEQNWMAVFVSTLAFFLTYFHLFFAKYDIKIPKEFQILIVVFVFASLFLGEVHSYYERFGWWDDLLHLLSGIGLGFVGFLILYIFYKSGKFSAPAGIIAMFSFCFALALGALWEVFEFWMDELFGLDMQKARNLEEVYGEFDTRLGVKDTMIDLMMDAVGALIASIWGYIYLKKGESFKWFDKLVEKFEQSNENLFKK